MRVQKLYDNVGFIDVTPDIDAGSFISIYTIKAERTALVDVGPITTIDFLFEGLRELAIPPEDINYVFTTHVHLDHNGALGEALKKMPKAVVVAHEKGIPHLVSPKRLWESSLQTQRDMALIYGQPSPVPENRFIIGSDKMKIDLGNTQIQVIFTPGHTSHHLSFLDKKMRRLFSGDGAGYYMPDLDIVRPSAPPPFNLAETLNSVDKQIDIAPETICYTHFGCLDTGVDMLIRYKQRLLLWGNVIAEHSDETDVLKIYDKIKKKDRPMERLERLPPLFYDREFSSIENCIRGYIGFFKKFGTECLSAHNKG